MPKTLLHEIFTKDELAEMERCLNRLVLYNLMVTLTINALPDLIDKRFPR